MELRKRESALHSVARCLAYTATVVVGVQVCPGYESWLSHTTGQFYTNVKRLMNIRSRYIFRFAGHICLGLCKWQENAVEISFYDVAFDILNIWFVFSCFGKFNGYIMKNFYWVGFLNT